MNEIVVEYEDLGLEVLDRIRQVYGDPVSEKVAGDNGNRYVQREYMTKAGAKLHLTEDSENLRNVSVKGLSGVVRVVETELESLGIKLEGRGGSPTAREQFYGNQKSE